MKKIIAITLAIMLAVCCSISAFAENATPGTTTLTTTVPDAQYTLNIPADQEIPFGIEATDIGTISVTDASGFGEKKNLDVTLTFSPFSSEDVSTTIPFFIRLRSTEYKGYSNPTWDTVDHSERIVKTGDKITFKGVGADGINELIWGERYHAPAGDFIHSLDETYVVIKNEDWSKALGGDYSATITFSAEVVAEAE